MSHLSSGSTSDERLNSLDTILPLFSYTINIMALITVHELQTLIQHTLAAHSTPLAIESLPVAVATGRVLAENITANIHIPHANVSAMDGYALPAAALAGSRWRLIGEAAAGHGFDAPVPADACIRIMTGAVVPDDCVTVVMQENVRVEGDEIVLTQDASAGSHIRYRGEEVAQGSTVLHAGRILRAADVLLLAALGVGQVPVYRKLKVAVLSTGDELCEPDTALQHPSQIYDSNRYMLMARLHQLAVDVIDLGKVADDLDRIMHVLQTAAQQADVIITSGGVSVGDYDYLREAVQRLGVIHHYKVAMKPGKPFVFGRLGQAWYFGLPGNPISGFAGFDQFLKAALWQLNGANELPKPLSFPAILSQPVKKTVGRMDFQRAIIQQQADGTWLAAPCGSQDSHRVLGMSQANAYLILPLESGSLPAGSQVMVQPFSETFL